MTGAYNQMSDEVYINGRRIIGGHQVQPRTGPPRVLVAVVLNQDEAGVNWTALEACLREQETSLLWDLLIVDVTEQASSNYAAWLHAVVDQWPGHRCRVRRLSGEDRGIHQRWPHPELAMRAGVQAALALFHRWRSYQRLWILRAELRPASDALQRSWDADELIRPIAEWERWFASETGIDAEETRIDLENENLDVATVGSTLVQSDEVREQLRAAGLEPD